MKREATRVREKHVAGAGTPATAYLDSNMRHPKKPTLTPGKRV